MILPDVNVLVNAFRQDATSHEECHAWLEAVINGQSRFGIAPQTLSSLLRIVTHSRVFVQPSTLEEAITWCDFLLARPQAVSIQPGERHWRIFTNLCAEADARGNLVPDAWFAALAIESGCRWITLDRDYSRFPGLDWKTPV